jgi:hypothetical protein
MKLVDMTGQRFGRLTAISRSDASKWLFSCDCGQSKPINGKNVRRGLVTSCGCVRREVMAAEHFYPIRADFTTSRAIGEEFASHLMTGRPVLAHRDLGNSLSAMLRPRGTAWFHARTGDEDINNDATAKKWLDAKSDVMRRNVRPAGAVHSRDQAGRQRLCRVRADRISVDPNLYGDGMLYRNWHLKDVAWCENAELVIDTVHRNWMLEARQLVKLFPKTVSDAVKKLARKNRTAKSSAAIS